MILDLKGGSILGADITLSADDIIVNGALLHCNINDIEAKQPFAERCDFWNCRLRSQWEAEERLKRPCSD